MGALGGIGGSLPFGVSGITSLDAISRDEGDAGAAVDDHVACGQSVVVRVIGGARTDGLVGHRGGIRTLRRQGGRQQVAGADPERRPDQNLRHSS